MEEIKKELAKDIKVFIKSYAKIHPDWDYSIDEFDEKYTSPDAYELLYSAERLEQGHDLDRFPWSEYSSGGYKSGEGVFEKHQDLLERVKPFIKR